MRENAHASASQNEHENVWKYMHEFHNVHDQTTIKFIYKHSQTWGHIRTPGAI